MWPLSDLVMGNIPYVNLAMNFERVLIIHADSKVCSETLCMKNKKEICMINFTTDTRAPTSNKELLIFCIIPTTFTQSNGRHLSIECGSDTIRNTEPCCSTYASISLSSRYK